MTPKKTLCIHDLSVMGRSSLAVITPVISRMGIQAVGLPTAVLSTHYGGLGKPAEQDLTDFCFGALEHYERLGIEFDSVYSGFLSSPRQIDLVRKAFSMTKPGARICDPVMADHGKLYSSITPRIVEAFRDLCDEVDLIIPNPTEALILLDRDCAERPMAPRELKEIAASLADRYTSVLITGAELTDGSHRAVCCEKGSSRRDLIPLYYSPVNYPGTGDLFGACLTGFMTGGMSLAEACERSARFTEKVVAATYRTGSDTRFGVHLEPMLKELFEQGEKQDEEE